MSVQNRSVSVKMVRIQLPDRKQPISHRQAVITILEDSQTDIAYLRISENQQIILSEELNHFEWIEESSSDGVATITSSSAKIIIIYNAQDRVSRDLFVRMRTLLQKDSHKEESNSNSWQCIRTPEDHIELATNDLIKYIQEGSSKNAEHAAQFLAQSRAQLQFNIINRDNNQNEMIMKKPETKTPSSTIFQLQLQIECYLNRKPLNSTIYVHTGTNLRTLKEQIENKTGIKCKDQFWYAFGQYIIPDEYEFGSEEPVVRPRPKTSGRKNQVTPPNDPIRVGDTLILYIAQLRPYAL
ncbi:hypothetical protein I4U23_024567 [Adineta vaga]|nr:hypothetical protein I4U23_024567 [Adineta vaga]